MILLRDTNQQLPASVVTIGNFDGVHKGHQQLIESLVSSSQKMHLPSVLLTFEPHPFEFFPSSESIARLMRFFEKWDYIKKYFIDYFYCMRFNQKLAALSPEDFVKKILVDQLRAKKVIVGDDFRFGAKRAGDVETLKKLGIQYGFEVEAMPQAMHAGERISSSRVRDAIKKGDFEKAAMMLARPFTLSGKVAYGSQLGRQLGYPTANIYLRRKQVPMMGIFVVRVYGLCDTPLAGVASIGYRPTFDGKQILLEVFIFDFDETIYGRSITVAFLHKIRDEAKFDTVEKLVLQIADDVAMAKAYIKLQQQEHQ